MSERKKTQFFQEIGMKIPKNLNSEIKKVWDEGINWFKNAGAEIIEISLPHTKAALPTYYIIAPAEASANLARYDGIRYGFRHDADDIKNLYLSDLDVLEMEDALRRWQRELERSKSTLLNEESVHPQKVSLIFERNNKLIASCLGYELSNLTKALKQIWGTHRILSTNK